MLESKLPTTCTCFHNTLFDAKPTRGLMGIFIKGQPLLSSHPQGKGQWLLDAGWKLNRGKTIEEPSSGL